MVHLKKLREEQHLTQSQLGEMFNLSGGAIGSYERGTRLPDVNILKSMCQYFDVSLEYLLDMSECRKKDINEEEIFKYYYSIPEEDRASILRVVKAYSYWRKHDKESD